MARKRFISLNEGFDCEHCGFRVGPHPAGSCRNHCPRCLWSKHVDKEVPGDRLSSCRGLMAPVGVVVKGGRVSVVHRCEKCGLRKPNQTAVDDDQELIIRLSTQRTG